ncbi:MAG: tRNA (guanosine(37)-N1)-methyltransferase TrmD [Oligoflexales bacterium]|nr:tRNA (guanosine(37)-N1)-methyltransferase TrmD [Oligoflexales bacterium]
MLQNISIATLYPSFVEAYLKFGILRNAIEKNILSFNIINIRDYAVDRHGSVDDHPYGGGDGMVLRCEPLVRLVSVFEKRPLIIYTSPSGRLWNHEDAVKFSGIETPLLFICGRFAGVDQRFIDSYVDDEISFGDFVVSGGELPVLMMVDSIARQIPGVIGNPISPEYDSFTKEMKGLIEYPLYTRPEEFEGMRVPSVLLSGNHRKIDEWRRKESIMRTEHWQKSKSKTCQS